MKKQKSTKLSLINLLSDPYIEIQDWKIDIEIKKIDISTADDPFAEPLRRQTGRSFINITIIKHESGTDYKKYSGTAEGTKTTD